MMMDFLLKDKHTLNRFVCSDICLLRHPVSQSMHCPGQIGNDIDNTHFHFGSDSFADNCGQN